LNKNVPRYIPEKLWPARKMKKNGLDNTMIADILELPIEEIEKL